MESTPSPRLLFRFRSLAPHSKPYVERLITRSELYFSDPASLNDPYDCQLSLDPSGTDEEWKAHLMYALKNDPRNRMSHVQRIRHVKDYMKQQKHREIDGQRLGRITSTFGVVCFSATMNNMLLWSHYADNHRGICLIFEPQKDLSGLLLETSEVRYLPVLPKVRIVDLGIRLRPESTVKNLLLTKSVDWKYEQEYRILLPRGAKVSLKHHPAALVGIVLGARISKEDASEVCRWAADHPFQPIVHRATLDRSAYGISIDPVSSI